MYHHELLSGSIRYAFLYSLWTNSSDPCFLAVASCTSIIINGITVPANTTLDLTKLKPSSTVSFSGTTTFDHHNWLGPLVSISGTNITVKGSGTLDGLGAQYWDGLGGGGGVSE